MSLFGMIVFCFMWTLTKWVSTTLFPYQTYCRDLVSLITKVPYPLPAMIWKLRMCDRWYYHSPLFFSHATTFLGSSGTLTQLCVATYDSPCFSILKRIHWSEKFIHRYRSFRVEQCFDYEWFHHWWDCRIGYTRGRLSKLLPGRLQASIINVWIKIRIFQLSAAIAFWPFSMSVQSAFPVCGIIDLRKATVNHTLPL